MLLQSMPSLLCWVTLYRGHLHQCCKQWKGHLYCKLSIVISKHNQSSPFRCHFDTYIYRHLLIVLFLIVLEKTGCLICNTDTFMMQTLSYMYVLLLSVSKRFGFIASHYIFHLNFNLFCLINESHFRFHFKEHYQAFYWKLSIIAVSF